MVTEHTLLSFIARRYISAREDAATDALGFILNKSKAAKEGLSALLQEAVPGVSPIARVKNPFGTDDGGVPDLACLDDQDKVQALIEAKFLAPLTYHQPNTYWKRLPSQTPSALVFLAPADRLISLLNELKARLEGKGCKLGEMSGSTEWVSVQARDSRRRLVLISWDTLLHRLVELTAQKEDSQAHFELEQLRGLASNEYAKHDLSRDGVLQNLIRDAIRQAEQEGWVNTDGLAAGGNAEFPGRYLRLAGAYAFLGLNYKGRQETGKLIWLVFNEYGSNPGQVTIGQVHERLGDTGKSGAVRGREDDYSVLLETPLSGIDLQARVRFIVDQLADIGRRLNPEAFEND